jgi:hypothetical protein
LVFRYDWDAGAALALRHQVLAEGLVQSEMLMGMHFRWQPIWRVRRIEDGFELEPAAEARPVGAA